MSYQQYLSDAESLYDQSNEAMKNGNVAQSTRCAIASILFSFIAIEYFINNMMEDFNSLPKDMFTIHERGFLSEYSVQFESAGEKAGQFVLIKKRDYKRLEDKILFLLAKFGDGVAIDKGSILWQRFQKAKDLRDKLTHPRGEQTVINIEDSKETMHTVTEIIQMLSVKVWGKKADI